MNVRVNRTRLNELRLEKGFSFQDLADDINKMYGSNVVSRASLQRWEQNENAFPHNAKLVKLANYFGIPVEELIIRCNEKETIANEIEISSLASISYLDKMLHREEIDIDEYRILVDRHREALFDRTEERERLKKIIELANSDEAIKTIVVRNIKMEIIEKLNTINNPKMLLDIYGFVLRLSVIDEEE